MNSMAKSETSTSRRRKPERQNLSDGLGWRLRRARESKNIGVRELARRIGVSASLISQIETGKSEPSVSTLMAIITELDLPVNEIVFDSKEAERAVAPPATRTRAAGGGSTTVWNGGSRARQSPVQLGGSRRSIHLDSGVIWQRLTAQPDHDVDFLYVHYEPGGASTPSKSLMRHSGREYGYVISGSLRVSVGFEDYELSPGDSIAFDSTEPHRLATIGDEPAEAIWFVVGRRQRVDDADSSPPSP
jgi:transcriptional regulator with XRE-family HTH domain/mannose-6-phosphate isomerase-like protein (cupin superfamily)